MDVTRRSVLGLALGGLAASFASYRAEAARFVNTTGLGAGRFVWQPGLAPQGRALVILTLRDQLLHVYRAGAPIGIARVAVSAPAAGRVNGLVSASVRRDSAAPGGRTSWLGTPIWLDRAQPSARPVAGALARLPDDLAPLVAEATAGGANVVITDARSTVTHLTDAGWVDVMSRDGLSGHAEAPATLVVSRADRLVRVVRDGAVVATCPVDVTGGRDLGTHVFELLGAAGDQRGLKWLAVGLSRDPEAAHVVRGDAAAVLARLRLSGDAARDVLSHLRVGSALLVSDAAYVAPGPGASVEVMAGGGDAPAGPGSDKVAARPARGLRSTAMAEESSARGGGTVRSAAGDLPDAR